ncbi:MAG: (2Fe-2S)-binding protein [Aeromicrobium sp.]|uniref:(2Fe-2S)-binding protein n=1 Tax=Aeromicrobium sp. TaxID=1871063 RepID=UPI0039E5F332
MAALADTLARLPRAPFTVTFGRPDGADWFDCDALDRVALDAWKEAVDRDHRRLYGRTAPAAAAGHLLAYYAEIPATVGARCLRLDRRVPRLDREALSFRRRTDAVTPDAAAVRSPVFWCLPGDPAADSDHATVLADEQALAERLRRELDDHAEAFLTVFDAGRLLPRRTLRGAFPDALDAALGRQRTYRVSCCYYHHVSVGGATCATCPRRAGGEC